jgi:hypothetical protein
MPEDPTSETSNSSRNIKIFAAILGTLMVLVVCGGVCVLLAPALIVAALTTLGASLEHKFEDVYDTPEIEQYECGSRDLDGM